MDLYPNMQRHTPKPKPYATEAIVDGRWKLLTRDGQPLELFDVVADPGETKNLLSAQPRLAQRLAGQICDFLAASRDRSGFPPSLPPSQPVSR